MLNRTGGDWKRHGARQGELCAQRWWWSAELANCTTGRAGAVCTQTGRGAQQDSTPRKLVKKKEKDQILNMEGEILK